MIDGIAWNLQYDQSLVLVVWESYNMIETWYCTCRCGENTIWSMLSIAGMGKITIWSKLGIVHVGVGKIQYGRCLVLQVWWKLIWPMLGIAGIRTKITLVSVLGIAGWQVLQLITLWAKLKFDRCLVLLVWEKLQYDRCLVLQVWGKLHYDRCLVLQVWGEITIWSMLCIACMGENYNMIDAWYCRYGENYNMIKGWYYRYGEH